MADLLWPGDERAEQIFAPLSVFGALVTIEEEWLTTLVDGGVAPATARADVHRLASRRDIEQVALGAEASGNPVVPLLSLLRERLRDTNADAARWLHRGLTSQDVLDTALVMNARDTRGRLLARLDAQVESLARLADRHRDHLMAGRTLTQHAVPITFGLKAAQWLQGVLDARDDLRALTFPVQIGGAAGTLSALSELAGDPDAEQFLAADVARRLGLDHVVPWHTNRAPFTRYADALVRATDAMAHVANDVLVLARPEIAELAEPAVEGRGGSSTMPQKANPVLSVLIRRAALAAPGLAAQLHVSATEMVDERADGGWHLEWSTLATLSRRSLVAASQTAELLDGLHVDTGRMAAVVKQQTSSLLAEHRSLASLSETEREADFDAGHYLGATSAFIDQILARAHDQETP